MAPVQFLKHESGPAERPEKWRSALTHTHTYSGRADHGGTIRPPESYQGLTDWTRRQGISALGMGSPYTPATAAEYDRFDGAKRAAYYSAGFDTAAVRGDDEIRAMLAEVNRLAAGSTYLYLDNETPKGRYGHLWWVGFDLDYPAWHDYDQDFDRWMVEESREGEDGDEPMPYLRRPYREIVALQRAKGAMANWAHPTSWWTGDNGQFITNIASEMPAHLIADGYLDGLVVMGYHAHRPEYQALWFHLLDRGYRIPGVAEMDCGLSDAGLWKRSNPYLTLFCLPGPPATTGHVVQGWRSGQLVCSSGPWLELDVDSVCMGAVVPTGAGETHIVTIRCGGPAGSGPDWTGDLELLGRGGEILWRRCGATAGTYSLLLPGSAHRSYVIARLFGVSGETELRDTEQLALSNPVHLHPPGAAFEQPATTELTVTVDPVSPWRGGRVRFEGASGEVLGEAGLNEAVLTETVPAGGRYTLIATDGTSETHYLINANARLQDLQRYLYRGRFLRDFPTLRPGEVPPEAWQFDKYTEVMRALQVEI